ncbi:MAG: GH12 family glycosyl hydrolase domain-containing protein [Polyangiaceae bacterium]
MTTPVSCTDTSTSAGTVNQQYGSAQLSTTGNKTYFLQSNWWQTFANETEDYAGLGFTVHNPQGASVPESNGAPMGFPSIFIGQYAGNSTVGSNLPMQVSALTSVPTTYETNNSSIGTTDHNAAYDVWFTQDDVPLGASQSNPGTGGAYLMVWMFKPTDRQPRGSDSGHTGQNIAGVSGTWSVWVDTTNPPCVSYVSDTPLDGLTFDLNDFIKDAVAKGYGVTSSMYLSIVFGGFEIWGGADGIQLTQFCASVN